MPRWFIPIGVGACMQAMLRSGAASRSDRNHYIARSYRKVQNRRYVGVNRTKRERALMLQPEGKIPGWRKPHLLTCGMYSPSTPA